MCTACFSVIFGLHRLGHAAFWRYLNPNLHKDKALPLTLGSVELATPIFLAPLAGITDLPFRRLVARFGAGLVVSEMVASEEIVRARPEARARAELGLGEQATAVQLAGRDPYWMAEGARFVEAQGAKLIDINMGCPSKRVTTGLCGSALLRDLDLALNLIEAVVKAVKVPVTLKTRLGWDDSLHNAPQLARLAEGAGVQLITIHGRTRCQFYKGHANWSAIRAVKDAVKIPVIANGDITDSISARKALQLSGADGVMIGRGAQGAPWRLAEVAHDLFDTPAPVVPEGGARARMIFDHYDDMLTFYGRELGLRMARKHLGWYLETAGLPHTREAILTSTDPAEVIQLLVQAFAELELAA